MLAAAPSHLFLYHGQEVSSPAIPPQRFPRKVSQRVSQRGFPTGSSRFQHVPAGRSKCSRLSRFQQVPAGLTNPGRFSRYQQDPAVPSNAQQDSARCSKIQQIQAERGKRSTFQQVPTGSSNPGRSQQVPAGLNLLRRFVHKICGEAKT